MKRWFLERWACCATVLVVLSACSGGGSTDHFTHGKKEAGPDTGAADAGRDAPSDAHAPDAQPDATSKEAGPPSCKASQTLCAGVCVDETTDPKNCGKCGAACALGEQCTNSACASCQLFKPDQTIGDDLVAKGATFFALEAVGDVDGNGAPDILVDARHLPGASPHVLEAYLNDGSAHFGSAQVIQNLPANYACGNSPWIGDLNGDGVPDLLFASCSLVGEVPLAVEFGKGNLVFDAPNFYPTAAATGLYAFTDLNGDGAVDVVESTVNVAPVTFYTYLNDGHGAFSAAGSFTENGYIAFGDVNGDGAADIVGMLPNGTLFEQIGNKDGTFQAPVTIALLPVSQTYGFGLTQLTDLNGDGHLDILLSGGGLVNGTQTFGVKQYFGHGDGSFDPAVQFSLGSNGPTPYAERVNLDNVADLVEFGGQVGMQPQVWFGHGDGTYLSQAAQLPAPPASLLPTFVDLNQDGAVDLIAADQQNSDVTNPLLGVYLNGRCP